VHVHERAAEADPAGEPADVDPAVPEHGPIRSRCGLTRIGPRRKG
jgi:hypothetical protein